MKATVTKAGHTLHVEEVEMGDPGRIVWWVTNSSGEMVCRDTWLRFPGDVDMPISRKERQMAFSAAENCRDLKAEFVEFDALAW